MDIITTFEVEIANTLSGIDESVRSSGYHYYTNSGQIQCYDEVLSLGRNITSTTIPIDNFKSVNHIFEQDENSGVVNQDWATGQGAITQRINYVIRSKVHNYGSEGGNIKNNIRIRMSECLADLLYAFGQNYTLGGKAQWIRFVSATRQYDDITNNRIQSGTLVTVWEVVYSQSFNNPDIPACW